MTAGGGSTYPEVVRLLKESVAQKGQRAVARESGVALLSIQRYLKGVGEPTTATLQKLADYFEVSVAYLRGEEPLVTDYDSVIKREGLNNLDLPSDLAPLVSKIILFDLLKAINGTRKAANEIEFISALGDSAANIISVINSLANYYRYEGATGLNPYKGLEIKGKNILADEIKNILSSRKVP